MKSQDRPYATQTFRPVHFSTLEEVAVDPVLETVESAGFNLVLYNDEHNTFDHVIDMLVSVCDCIELPFDFPITVILDFFEVFLLDSSMVDSTALIIPPRAG